MLRECLDRVQMAAGEEASSACPFNRGQACVVSSERRRLLETVPVLTYLVPLIEHVGLGEVLVGVLPPGQHGWIHRSQDANNAGQQSGQRIVLEENLAQQEVALFRDQLPEGTRHDSLVHISSHCGSHSGRKRTSNTTLQPASFSMFCMDQAANFCTPAVQPFKEGNTSVPQST